MSTAKCDPKTTTETTKQKQIKEDMLPGTLCGPELGKDRQASVLLSGACGAPNSQLSSCMMHVCTSMGKFFRSMGQARVSVILQMRGSDGVPPCPIRPCPSTPDPWYPLLLMRVQPCLEGAAPDAVEHVAVAGDSQQFVVRRDLVEMCPLLVGKEQVGLPDGVQHGRVQVQGVVGILIVGQPGVVPLLPQEDVHPIILGWTQ